METAKGRASLGGAPGRSDISLRNDADNGGWIVHATRDGPVDHLPAVRGWLDRAE